MNFPIFASERARGVVPSNLAAIDLVRLLGLDRLFTDRRAWAIGIGNSVVGPPVFGVAHSLDSITP
jgi:hypothetical protein